MTFPPHSDAWGRVAGVLRLAIVPRPSDERAPSSVATCVEVPRRPAWSGLMRVRSWGWHGKLGCGSPRVGEDTGRGGCVFVTGPSWVGCGGAPATARMPLTCGALAPRSRDTMERGCRKAGRRASSRRREMMCFSHPSNPRDLWDARTGMGESTAVMALGVASHRKQADLARSPRFSRLSPSVSEARFASRSATPSEGEPCASCIDQCAHRPSR